MNEIKNNYKFLINRIRERGTSSGQNIIAFSGGVDSSLVAYFVYQVFRERAIACLGVSASLSNEQHLLAKKIAEHIGIRLIEVETDEVSNPDYIKNEGMSCYHCKSELYSTLLKLYNHVTKEVKNESVILFNGTNIDDKEDPTRVGLKAASEFHVESPLDLFTKIQIRDLSKYVGLPNWNCAAAPCLRSRLQFGVQATEENLQRIEDAEKFVRDILKLDPTTNLRVRHILDNTARIELSENTLSRINGTNVQIENHFKKLGFRSISFQKFQSGSLSRTTSEKKKAHE